MAERITATPARPELVTVGTAPLGFAENFPFGVTWPPCRTIGREAHAHALAGVAALSNAEATETASLGEELALFERRPTICFMPRQLPNAVIVRG